MNQEKIIIGIAGEIASGKGTVTTYLQEKYGAHTVRYSAVLQDILQRLNLPYERENLALLAEALRTTFGAGILSQALMGDIAASQASVIVVDGIRKRAELDALRTQVGFVLFFVDAPLRTRYERLHGRREKADDATKTYEAFVADHKRAADCAIPQLKPLADVVLDNSSDDLAALYQQIDAAMHDLRKENISVDEALSTR